ncbi:hypothetical protein AK812_SmicGene3947 [Symbiodinium microadriaticum]|uniref:Uncharacterized protein n=1 Tax=Symbiodinium microadriaticum TaxID=2951 RepID=A0A1Q9EXC8_SYMMI|nr:hypothetical protein AK812_SmicGene3947 [Symbiodinium microadriaticum]
MMPLVSALTSPDIAGAAAIVSLQAQTSGTLAFCCPLMSPPQPASESLESSPVSVFRGLCISDRARVHHYQTLDCLTLPSGYESTAYSWRFPGSPSSLRLSPEVWVSQNAAQAGMKKAVKDQRQSVACGGFTNEIQVHQLPTHLITRAQLREDRKRPRAQRTASECATGVPVSDHPVG